MNLQASMRTAMLLSAVSLRAEPVHLFAFDNHTLPFKNNLELTFEIGGLYYEAWDISGSGLGASGVGLATLPRDRFACLSTRDPGEGFFTRQPLAHSGPRTLAFNADGLSATAFLRVELIDRNGTPILGYSGASAAVMQTSGLKTLVAWPGGNLIKCPNPAIRVRASFAGADAPKVRFYAACLE